MSISFKLPNEAGVAGKESQASRMLARGNTLKGRGGSPLAGEDNETVDVRGEHVVS